MIPVMIFLVGWIGLGCIDYYFRQRLRKIYDTSCAELKQMCDQHCAENRAMYDAAVEELYNRYTKEISDLWGFNGGNQKNKMVN